MMMKIEEEVVDVVEEGIILEETMTQIPTQDLTMEILGETRILTKVIKMLEVGTMLLQRKEVLEVGMMSLQLKEVLMLGLLLSLLKNKKVLVVGDKNKQLK